MKKKFLSLILAIAIVMTSNVFVFAKDEDVDTMSKEQISKIADYYLSEFIGEELDNNLRKMTIDYKDDIMIELYDLNDNVIAYLIPMDSNGFMVVDARKNGYGLLETSLSEEQLEDILKKESEGKLYYIFPSRIFLENELEEYIDESGLNKEDIASLTFPEKNYQFGGLNKSISRARNEVIELTDEADFVNIGGCYGGDQSWFDDKFNQDKGCGTVAASNITAHMADYVSGCSRLYGYGSLSKRNFKKHMNEMLNYVKPTVAGVPTLGYLARGVERFANDNNVDIKAYWSDERPTFRSLSNYIKDGLRINSPVAYLQYYNTEITDLNIHWVTITKYFKNSVEGDSHIAVSTWGTRKSINLNTLYDNELGGGVIYFEVE